ncbi:1,4-dihydroxy-6-naphthoate synthase [Pollutibacter soli]|uniref:1,4-dihydroxy-6-naphthoate synthase n=1 Tax=Pollutibacter soli TaxID=3034157 RepID=UPI0030131FB9
MKLSLCFSPCPNDTFIFDALVNKKIDTEGLEFDVRLEDVETLNRLVLNDTPDVSKISYGVLPLIVPNYRVLEAGSALGRGVGPLLVAANEPEDANELVKSGIVALPGRNTTANLLYTLAYPETGKKIFMPFDQIENAVLDGAADAGVLIHEGRFTYEKKGLKKLMDLGAFWENQTGNPIPLGGIVMRRTLDHDLMKKVDRLIRKSIEYSWSTYPILSAYVKEHAQEMDESIMRSHIDLYVNKYSSSLGPDGRSAIWTLLETGMSFFPEPQAGSYEVFI